MRLFAKPGRVHAVKFDGILFELSWGDRVDAMLRFSDAAIPRRRYRVGDFLHCRDRDSNRELRYRIISADAKALPDHDLVQVKLLAKVLR